MLLQVELKWNFPTVQGIIRVYIYIKGHTFRIVTKRKTKLGLMLQLNITCKRIPTLCDILSP